MGGKGRKRREKNYRAAHGGQNRLPPPPVPSSLDAVPSKLRKLMAFTSPRNSEASVNNMQRKKGDRGGNNLVDRRPLVKDILERKHATIEREEDDGQHGTGEKRKKKRKRKEVDDLRFDTAVVGAVGLRRKERKKKLFEARKKNHRKVEEEKGLDFPGQEKIEFGDVVEAPPKLMSLPKVSKSVKNALQERIRLKAVEAYRTRRGWTSRPGIRLPLPDLTS